MAREVRNVFIGLELDRLLGLSKLDHFHIMSNYLLMWPLFFRLARHDPLVAASMAAHRVYHDRLRSTYKNSSRSRLDHRFYLILRKIDMFTQCK